ncbi:MAG: tetratricopeptide repeat protein [Thermodesulfobacteriota bacterium]
MFIISRLWRGLKLAGLILMMIFQPAFADSLNDYTAGVQAARNNKHDEAVRLFTQAIESGKLDEYHLVRAYTRRGHEYLVGKDDPDKALDDYNAALNLNPQYAEAYFERAGAYAKKNRVKEALADANKAVDLEPGIEKYRMMLDLIRKMQP